jgi:dynein light intermediate chain 1
VTDILARLSLYLLSDPSPSFTPLLQPLLTPQTIPNTLIVILLDWSQPWLWLRQLRDWVRLLRTLLVSLDDNCKTKMAEVMISWRDRGRGTTTLDGIGVSTSTEGDVTLPLGPGEWEEALGLPLCIVCQNVGRHALMRLYLTIPKLTSDRF